MNGPKASCVTRATVVWERLAEFASVPARSLLAAGPLLHTSPLPAHPELDCRLPIRIHMCSSQRQPPRPGDGRWRRAGYGSSAGADVWAPCAWAPHAAASAASCVAWGPCAGRSGGDCSGGGSVPAGTQLATRKPQGQGGRQRWQQPAGLAAGEPCRRRASGPQAVSLIGQPAHFGAHTSVFSTRHLPIGHSWLLAPLPQLQPCCHLLPDASNHSCPVLNILLRSWMAPSLPMHRCNYWHTQDCNDVRPCLGLPNY